MTSNILKINKNFFNSLSNKDNFKILKIYGYNSPEIFINEVIKKLNFEYNYLNIQGFDFLNEDEESDYHMYNGYVEGSFTSFDKITISFTTIAGKEGNVFLSQQIMPFITSMVNKSTDFLINNRIKKICILTTHKSSILSPDKNSINSSVSSIQTSVNYINTLGFDVIDIFRIINLSTKTKYHNIEELLDHTKYLQKNNQNNSQFEQVYKHDGVYYGDFEEEPKGQESKFFSLKIYACAMLLKGKNLDISRALKKSNDITLVTLSNFISFLNNTDVSLFEILNEVSEDYDYLNEVDSTEIDFPVLAEKDKLEPIYRFNTKGQKIYKTQKLYKTKSFEIHDYLCACHKDNHYYFLSEATNKRYVEGHHMIPMEYQDLYWKDKKINLDCLENIIPLCSHCHGKIHKSIKSERIQILNEVYNRYEIQLTKIDKELNFANFAKLYNVYIY